MRDMIATSGRPSRASNTRLAATEMSEKRAQAGDLNVNVLDVDKSGSSSQSEERASSAAKPSHSKDSAALKQSKSRESQAKQTRDSRESNARQSESRLSYKLKSSEQPGEEAVRPDEPSGAADSRPAPDRLPDAQVEHATEQGLHILIDDNADSTALVDSKTKGQESFVVKSDGGLSDESITNMEPLDEVDIQNINSGEDPSIVDSIEMRVRRLLDRTELTEWDMIDDDTINQMRFERLEEVYKHIDWNQKTHGYAKSPDFAFKSEML